LHGAQISRDKSGKIALFSQSGWIHAGMSPAFQVSRAKLPHGVSYVSPLLHAFFLPRAPRLQAVCSREIVYMQAGQ
jgi:hypothetical protein